jgi:hypothetical protein
VVQHYYTTNPPSAAQVVDVLLKGSAMFLFSWGKRRQPSFLAEAYAPAQRGGVHPCTEEDLRIFNQYERSGAEHIATELNEVQWQATQARKRWLAENDFEIVTTP